MHPVSGSKSYILFCYILIAVLLYDVIRWTGHHALNESKALTTGETMAYCICANYWYC